VKFAGATRKLDARNRVRVSIEGTGKAAGELYITCRMSREKVPHHAYVHRGVWRRQFDQDMEVASLARSREHAWCASSKTAD
jgi:hypothetical protein